MQHSNSQCSRRMHLRSQRWPLICISAAMVLGLAGWVVSWPANPAPTRNHAVDYAQDQARRTFAVHGYYEIVGLSQNEDGSWHAAAQKGGESWRIQLSPYGLVSASATAVSSVMPNRQSNGEKQ